MVAAGTNNGLSSTVKLSASFGPVGTASPVCTPFAQSAMPRVTRSASCSRNRRVRRRNRSDDQPGTVLFQPSRRSDAKLPWWARIRTSPTPCRGWTTAYRFDDFVAHSYPAQYARDLVGTRRSTGCLDLLGSAARAARIGDPLHAPCSPPQYRVNRPVATFTTPPPARSTGAPRRGSGRRRICRPTTTHRVRPLPMVRSSRRRTRRHLACTRSFDGQWHVYEQLADRDQVVVWLGSIAGRPPCRRRKHRHRLSPLRRDGSAPGNWRRIGA